MKRLLHIIAATALALSLSNAVAAQQTTPLTTLNFDIVGVGIGVSPDYQAVPKGINSQVLTALNVADVDVNEILKMLPQDYTVQSELTGPAFATPIKLVTKPGRPFDIPTLPILGKYTLNNIRLCDGSGKTILGAVPQAVAIESIPDPIVTSVTTRQLTLTELQQRGVTFDSSNFTAYEFTAGIATESGQVPIKLPVVIPSSYTMPNPEDIPSPGQIGIVPPAVQVLPPDVPERIVPQNMQIQPFLMQVDEKEPIGNYTLPPIPGIIVIPGNIGFLHQYFSALVMVTNGANLQSGLTIKDVTATVKFPLGEDMVAGTDETPGDDPVRMAKSAAGYFPRTMTVYNAGPDGKTGTADDISFMNPSQNGQADFTIEGLKEGTHALNFDISATLEGLPVGPVKITGKASGAVLVRNPSFTLTFGHPQTVRSGEEYDLFITITNTSKAMANLVSVYLDPRALSGAAFVPGETPDKGIDTIQPGSSGTVRYRLKSQTTGAVTATAFESEDVKGRFILRSGVGERNIPLSPDSLILPYTGSLPQDLIDAAVGLLGQAWSVATAPSGALPSDVLPIGKQIVTNRAYDLSEAGLRVLIGEQTPKAVEAFVFDFYGSDVFHQGFDDLRRKSTQGLNLNAALAGIFGQEAASTGALQFQADYADLVTYRPGHISVITSEAPVRVQLTDGSNRKTGGLDASAPFREIPYGDQIAWSSECGVQSAECAATATARSTLSLLTKIESVSYRLDLKAEAAANLDLGVVLPDASGTLTQVRFTGLSLPAGASAWITLLPGTGTSYVLSIDSDGDGVVDSTVASSSVTAVPDHGPRVVAATQLVPGFGPGGDKHGRNVAVLFSERVTTAAATNAANYGVEENAVRTAAVQPGGRMAFLLLRDGIGPFYGTRDVDGTFWGRQLTVTGLSDLSGKSMTSSATLPIRITAQGPAAVVEGTVRKANGEPVANAAIKLLQLIWWKDPLTGVEEPKYAIFTEKNADANGFFHLDYVFQNDDPRGAFIVEATNPQTNEVGQLTTNVAYHGQRMNVDIFMKARGSVTGRVLSSTGTAVANATVQITTLNDSRSYVVTSDASGAFSFTNLSVGAFNLKAVHTASASEGTVMGTILDNGTGVTQDVTIYRVADVARGTVTGKVLAADGTTPKQGVIVIVETADKRYKNWMRTQEDGSFLFSNVFAGNISILARDDASGEKTTVNGTVVDKGTSVFTIVMTGTGTVTGTVTRGDGKSAAGLYVIAGVNGLKWVVQTDPDAVFAFPALPVGDITVEVLDPRDFNRTIVSGTVTLLAAGDIQDISLFAPDAALATGTIQGTVYKRDGSIWQNAEVRLIVDGFSYYIYTAGSDGKFVLPNLALGTYRLASISGTNVANATATLWYGNQTKNIELRAVGIGTVTGTIYDDAEKTIPTGADVTLISTKPNEVGWLVYETRFPTVVKSDPQTGRYTFTGVFAGSFTVSTSNVFRPVAVSQGDTVTSNGQIVTIDLALKGTPPPPPGDGNPPPPPPTNTMGWVSGTVYQPDGKTPVGEGVRVTVNFGGGVTLTTAPTGTFLSGQIIPAGNYCLTAEDPVTTLKGRSCVYVPTGQKVSTTIRLLGRGALHVRTLTAGGEIAPGIAVTASNSSFPNDSASGYSDASTGEITFSNLSEGTYAITAKDTFHGLGGGSQGTISTDGAVVNVDVRLAAAGTITGRFLKPDGVTSIGGGQVKLIRSGQVIGYAVASSAPEDLGTFRLEYVTMGDFTLEGYDPTTERTGRGGGRLSTNGETVTADVVVTPRGSVKGLVLNNSGSAPIANASVSISVTGVAGYNYSTSTGPDGGFLFTGVPAGKYSLDARDPSNSLHGYASGTLTYENEVSQATVRIAPTGSIEGIVFLPGGVTVALNSFVQFTNGTGRKQVDPVDGSFVYTNLAAGAGFTYSFFASESNTHRVGKTTVSLTTDGQVAAAPIVLRGVGTVTGKAFDANGTTALSGLAVTLTAVGRENATTNTDTRYTAADGSFQFTDVPEGTFTIQTFDPARGIGDSASGSITREGEDVIANLVLASVANVAGTVYKADGTTPAAAGGVKYTGCGKTYLAVIDTQGRYLFQNILLPCASFTLYMEDAEGIGIGYSGGSLAVSDSGKTLDMGTVVLDDKAIAVASVAPVNGSADVPVTTTIHIGFSERVKTSTVIAANIYLKKQGGTSTVACALVPDGDGLGATLTPSQPLAGETQYTVYVTTAVMDLVNRPLPQTFTSAFRTVDNTPPAVAAVSPANNATEVAQDGVVRVTFSEPVDAAFAGDIKLLLNGTTLSVQLDLLQSNTVAALTPLGGLLPDTVYTVSVSGVKDLAGNLLTGTFTSSFRTIDTIAPTVSSLTYSGDPIKNNNLPITAVCDPDTAVVDFLVDGVLVYTDNAAPFVYSMPLVKEGQVTIKGVARDQAGNRNPNLPWAKELTFTVVADMPPSAAITSPAESSQVSTGQAVSVSITATDDLFASEMTVTAVMDGQTLLNQTKTNASGKTWTQIFSFTVPLNAVPGSSIVITASAKDSGGNASPAVQRTVVVKDGTAPAVTSLTSAGSSAKYRPGGTGEAVVAATDNIGVTSISCLASGAASGAQTFIIDPAALATTQTFSFQVSASATPYQSMAVACSAKDAANNTSSTATISLQVADVVPPAVSSSNIANGATNVQAKPTLSVTFNETLLSSSVSGTTVALSPDNGAPASGAVSLSTDRKTISFTPSQNLAKATTYHLVINTGVKDDFGNGLAADYSLTFTTDATPPSVAGTVPANNATNIQARPAISATFSEPLLASTVNGTSVTLVADNGTAVAGSVSLSTDRKTATFTLTQDLVRATTYRLFVTAAVTDDIGNAVTGDAVLSFTTDNTPPAISTITPADGARDVSLGIAVVVRFTEAVNPATMTADRFIVTSPTGTVTGTLTLGVNNTMATFAPTSPMTFSTDYTVTLMPGIEDVMGNATAADIVTAFKTGSFGEQLRVVYYDTRYSSSWTSRAAARIYKNFLVANGFTAMNADELKTFMQGNGVGSIVVMAQDIAPATVADVQTSAAVIRKYLDAGGTVIWMQEVPLYYQGLSNGTSTSWGSSGGTNVLGITWSSGSCGSTDVYRDGALLGMGSAWTSCRPITSSQVTKVYAGTSSGASAWLKNYNTAYPQTGFIRLWDNSGDFTSRAYLEDLITILGLNNGDVKYPDLVAQYRMDGDWTDASGNGLTGASVNGAGWSDADKISGTHAASFDGVNDYVSVSDSSTLSITNAITIELWAKSNINWDGHNEWTHLVNKRQDNANGYGIWIHRDSPKVYFSVITPSGLFSAGSDNLEPHTWYHIAGTYDGSNIKMYINGTLVSTVAASGVINTNTLNLEIGRWRASYNEYFNGLVDEVSIYSRALAAEDILEDYNAGLSDDRIAPLPPVVEPVSSPTYENVITLSGTKDPNASVRVNGIQVVAIDGFTQWSVPYVLQLGQNVLHITSRDAAGNESPEVAVSVELAPAKGADVDLIGLWHFDGTWKDFSGNSNHCYGYNGPKFSTAAKVGTNAGSFDGADDFVSIADADMLSPQVNGKMSIGAWVYVRSYPTGGQNRAPIIAKGTSGNYEYALYVYSNGTAAIDMWTSAGNGHVWAGGGTVPLNQWTHVVGVYDASAAKKAVIYVNGVEEYSATAVSGTVTNGSSPLQIGRRPDAATGQYLNALIDEVFLSKKALTPDQVRGLFNGEAGPGTQPAQPQVEAVAATSDYLTPLSGTKEAGTAVWINGREVVPADGSTTWSVLYPLDAGTNTLLISTRNGSGQLSDPSTVTIQLSPEKQKDADLVALWHLDGTWSDYSGNSNKLVPYSPNVDGAAFTNDARVGAYAALFDGSNDYADAAAAASLSIGSQSWTVSSWVRTSYSGSSTMTILNRYECGWNCATSGGGSDGNANAYYGLYLDGNGFATFQIRSDNGTMLKVADTKDIRDGSWHHVSAILDRANRVMRMFVDGKEQAVVPAADLNAVNDAGSPLSIGAAHQYNQSALVNFFSGRIDEVSVYKRALLQDEVMERYTAGLTLDRTAPSVPTVNAVASPTAQSTVLLSGTKETGSSIRVNNTLVVPLDQNTTWQAQYSLPQLGDNTLAVTSRDSAGNQSDPLTISLTLQQANQADAYIVGLWHLDGTGNDYSGNGNHLTLKNTPAFSLDSAVGSNAVNLNGIEDYLEKTGPAGLSIGNQSWTVSAWIKTTAQNTDSMMVLERFECGWNNCSTTAAGSDGNTNAWYRLYVDASGKATFYVRSDDGNNATAADTQDLRDGGWHQVAGQIDRSAGRIRIFVDGVERYSAAAAVIGSINDAGSPLEIGRHSYGNQSGHTPQYFKGLIDEVTIYKRVVAAADILNGYVSGRDSQARPSAPTVDPVASPVSDHIITLSGTKTANCSVWVNGVEIVALDDATTWTRSYVLKPGANTLRVTVKDGSGTESSPVTVTVEVLAAKLADQDLVGLWHLDGNWYDYSGNGNDLTPANGADFTSDAQAGPGAGLFDPPGSNRYARRASGTGLPIGNSPRTYAAWIKPYSYPDATYNGIIAYGQMACNGKGSLLSIKNDGRISMAFWCDDAIQSVGPSVALNKWNHVAFTYDGGTKIRFYMNGRFIQEANVPSVPNTQDGPVRIGSTDDPGRTFNGLIDEAVIYKRALTDLEMEKLYNHGAGRVGVWHMNDTWEDASGSNNHGTPRNGVTFQENGRAGTSAGIFDGTDDFVMGSAPVLPAGNKACTVSAWIKPANGSQDRAVLEYGRGSGAASSGDFRVYVDAANMAAVGTGFGSNTVHGVKRLDDGKWHHIAGVYEGAGTNMVRIYVDGVLENSGTIAAPETALDGNYSIGAFLAGGGYFNGLLDEVVVYDRALSNYEIEKRLNEDLGRVGYWPLDNTWEDKSRNGNDGTAGNGATFTTDAKAGSHAGSFDGSDDYVTVGTDADVLFTGPHTLESWVKFTGFPTQSVPLGLVQPYRYGLWYDSIAKMIRAHRDSGSTIYYLDVYTGLAVNTWYHVAQVFDGTNLYIYMNGQLLAKGAGSSYSLANASNSAIMGRGWTTSDTGKLQGALDDVSLYSRALSADEILDKYNAVVSGGAIPSSPQVDPVASTTSDNTINLSGTKEAGTSVWINGVLAVPADSSTTWYAAYSLLPGGNIAYVSTQNSSGGFSDPVPVAVTVQPANQRDADLVGLWHMNGNWYDYSGNGNNGTVSGTATFSADSIAGTASASFNGSNSYVEVKNSSMLNPATITVGLWAKSNTSTWNNYGFLVSKRDAYILHPQNGSKEISFYIYANGNWRSVTYNDPGLNITEWHYYAGTYDGSTMKIYVDGVLKNSIAYAGTINTADTGSLFMGWDDGQSGRYFNGLVDEASLYKRALIADEIERIYHDGMGRVGVWHMNNTWNDASAGVAHGTASGDPLFAASARAGSTAAVFDGANDFVTGSAARFPAGFAARSVSAWVKTARGTQKRGVLSYGAGLNVSAPGDFALFIDETNRVSLASGNDVVSGLSAIVDGRWHFVTAVYEGPTTSIVRLFVDGALDGMGTITRPDTTAGSYVLGGFLNGTGLFAGSMDEVIVYDRAITAADVTRYYNADMARVAYWPLESDGTDGSGNGNTLNTGSAAFTSTGAKVGAGAAGFNGTNQYLANAAPNNVNLTANFTVSGWIYPRAAQFGGIIDRGAESYGGWEVFYETNQSISYRHNWNRSQGWEAVYTPAGSVPLNTWTHVAVVYGDKTATVYLNGIPTVTKSFTNNPIIDSGSWIELGVNRPGSDEYFNGMLDELEVYGRPLIAAEIREQFNVENQDAPPTAPVIDPLPATTAASSILITGSKQEGTSIWINGVLAEPSDGSMTWSATVALQPGANTITVWSRNSSGGLSDPATVVINVPPVVVSSSITNESKTAPTNQPISIVFSEALAASSVNASSVFLDLLGESIQSVAGSVMLSSDRKTVTFTQAAELVKGATFRLTVTTGVMDDFGNRLAKDFVLQFTTSFGLLEIKNQSNYILDKNGYFDIVITNSTVKTTMDIAASTINMTGSTLTAKGSVRASTLTLSASSVLTHEYSTTTAVWPLDIFADKIVIDGSSRIDVTGKGYLGGSSGGNSSTTGMTYGNTASGGSTQTSNTGNGGSYGGLGGIYSGGSVNTVYGDLMNPGEVGSGGGAGAYCPYYCYTQPGGNGGGLVKITAGALQVDGIITADGGAGTATTYNGGGGSGGGVNLHVSTLSGTGMIAARGGAGPGGAGGGGRIAIYYDVITLSTTSIVATGGKTGTGATASYNGGAGTVYLKSNMLPQGDLIIDNRGTSSNDSSTPLRAIGSGVISAVTSTSLTNSSAAWTAGALKGMQVNPNTNQATTFTVVDNTATTLYIDPANGDLTQVSVAGSAYTGVYHFNSMSVLGTSKVRCNDQVAADSGLTIDGSGTTLVTGDVRANTITLTNGGVLTHGNTTATTTYSLNLNATTLLAIDSSSKIDVTGRGYLGGSSGGNSSTTGMTYGNTASGGSTQTSSTGNGGSYGGLGGIYSGGSVNTVYGDLMNPGEVGSGGGAGAYCPYYCSSQPGGNGGGLVKITAGALQVDGSIIADGGAGTATTYNGGGGSGGGVNLHVSTLSGTGIIAARGGAGPGGAGGGGRIAVYYDIISMATTSIIATGGKTGSTASYNGGAGTVYLKSSAQFHGELIVDNGGMVSTNTTPLTGSFYQNLYIRNSANIVMTGNLLAEGNLVIDNSQLTATGSFALSGDLILRNNAVLTHPAATITTQSLLDVQATNIAIDHSSRIDVTGRGYLGGSSGGNSSTTGMTYGNTASGGSTQTSSTGNGGSYGGLGGIYSGGSVNTVYGDLMNPGEVGSGGGAGAYCPYYCSSQPGGNGGGLVKITAGALQVDGSIIADGGAGTATTYNGGGGSGGGVNLHVSTLSGTGIIAARGGAGPGGAGGGGRIAIYYDVITLSTTSIVATGGKTGTGATASYNGGAGTVYLKSNMLPQGDLIIDNRGTSSNDSSTPLRAIGSGVISAVTSTSLTNSSAAWTAGALKGMQVNPNTNQATTFTVVDNTATTLYIDPANGDLTQVSVAGSAYTGVYHFNSMSVLGTSKVRCNDQVAADSGLTIDGSGTTLVTGDVRANTITLTNGGVLTHGNTTATTTYSLNLNATTLLAIDSSSKIDVTGRGYLGGSSGGNSSTTGMTYGNTASGGSTQTSSTGNGGSYGGLGGIYSGGSVNTVYGDLMNPGEVGSGGGAGAYCPYYCSSQPGGNGGGLVKITAGALQVDGSIIADGGAGTATTYNGGGGSGGGVNLHVSTLSGTGMIAARGGAGPGGAGGGGRIAVYYDTLTLPTGNFMASGGKSASQNNSSYNGGAGTIYLKSNSLLMPDLIINNGGVNTSRATPISNSVYQASNAVVSGGAVVTYINP